MSEEIPDVGVEIANPRSRWVVWGGVLLGAFLVFSSSMLNIEGLYLNLIANPVVAVGVFFDLVLLSNRGVKSNKWMKVAVILSVLHWVFGFLYLHHRAKVRDKIEEREVREELRKEGYDV